MMNWIKQLRISHWIKNLFIFLPIFFGGEILNLAKLGDSLFAFLFYSLMASAIYIINDILDINEDREHEEKKFRPIASGSINPKIAIIVASILIIISLTLSFIFLGKLFVIIIFSYLAINLVYSFGLKNVPILDFFIIATGFELRVIAGGIASHVMISDWMLIMVFLLALLLSIAKRRKDVIILKNDKVITRKNAGHYSLEFLNSSFTMCSSVVIVSYIMYIISNLNPISSSVHYELVTIVFVLIGLMRYLQIILVKNNSGSPTEILFKDVFLIVCIVGWIFTHFLLIYFL